MDNSLLTYHNKIMDMVAVLKAYSSKLRHHIIIEPQTKLEEAVRLGFPTDIAKYYLHYYYDRNESETEIIIAYIEDKCIPYLENVVYHIESAMNRGGGSHSTNTATPLYNRPAVGATDKNDRELEAALGIKKGPMMSIAEADKQNANPHLTYKYIEDPNGDYIERLTGVRYRKNPLFNPNEEGYYQQYTVNCATCATAYALRLRGFDVVAKGNVEGSGSLNEKISDANEYLNVWKNSDGSKVELIHTDDWMKKQAITKMTENDYRTYFEDICKEKGVYVVMVQWKDAKSGHATILQRDNDGVLYYIEPQRYKPSRGEDGRRSIDDLLFDDEGKQRLSLTPPHGYGILRVDNKLFNLDYADLFEIK